MIDGSMKNRGTFTISIDLELAWGFCDKPIRPSLSRAIELERAIVKRILGLFSKYNVQATWTIVGHLLLSECTRHGETFHPEISRPVRKRASRDWFFQHPTNKDLLWYGSDIVEWIRGVMPKQEIGSQSFCHIPYSEKDTNRDAIKTDIEMAKKIHEDLGLPFETFVFPRNIVGYRELLAKSGIQVYRGNGHRWYDSIPSSFIKNLLFFSYFLIGIPPRTVRAVVDNTGMVNVPDSMLLLARNGIRGLVSAGRLLSLAVAGLNRAAERREIFHLWFHPSNFAYRTNQQFGVLESILKCARQLREDGRLEILTMGQIQKEVASADRWQGA